MSNFNFLLCLDVDTIIADLVYNETNTPIVRSHASAYLFDVYLSCDTNTTVISSSFDGNWRIGYYLDSQPHESDGLLQSLYNNGSLPEGIMELAVNQQGVTCGSVITLPVELVLNFSFNECEQALYVCVLVLPSNYATFNELNSSNNVACLLLDLYKDCYPGL